MFSSDFFLRLPPAVALLALSALFDVAAGHALPRQTKTVELRELDALPWPLHHAAVATPAPDLPADLQLRQLNTVCGYIGGDPELPATCSAGSHCAVDVEHGAIGCCPDGGACTQGIFTGCVDANSDPQTEINPYVYTCGGSDVCYKNAFDGGYFQYGCGDASNWATSVVMTASGKASLDLSSLSLQFTAEPTTLSEPTTIGSRTAKSTDSKTSAESSTKSSTKSTTKTSSKTTTTDTTTDSNAPTSSATATDAADSAPDANGDDKDHTGAIVGGTVGGVAALAALLTLGIFLWRRKKGNTRKGPGAGQETEYISPMNDNQHNFAPLPTMREVDEENLPQNLPPAHRTSGEFSSDANDAGPIAYRPNYPYGYGPGSTAGGVMAVGGGDGHMDGDQVPLTREIDDFSRGFNTAIDDIQEDNAPHSNGYNMGTYPGPRGGDGGRPLWQQNRRRSRNLMWM